MEILPGIHRIVFPLGDRFVACYALRGERRTLLLDTAIDPAVASHIGPGLEQAGIPLAELSWVVNSHNDFDHSGGNAAMRASAPAALLCCHRLDHDLVSDVERLIERRYRCYAADHGIDESPDSLAWLRANVRHAPVDLQLRGGELFALDDGFQVEVLHVPGHSLGHIALYDRRQQVLLGQDCVLGGAVPTRDGKPAFPPTYRYVDEYLATIDRLESLPIDALLTAHYAPMLDARAVRSFLAETRRFVLAAEAGLLETLAASRTPLTMRDLIARLSAKLGAWPEAAGEFLVWPFTGHLERLQKRNTITRVQVDGVAAFTLKRA